tara:strand:- start:331 stop:1320 length:990 start_codon:yes stop_codon:yes gene_type:complete
MKICFLDFTNFKYSFEDKLSPKLRGAETVLINLSYNLRNLDNEIYVFNNSSKDYSDKNFIWTDINNIKKYDIDFDIAISNGDINLLDKVKSKKKFAISYSIQTIEKFIRKKQLLTFLKNKPKIILIGEYHKTKRSYLTRLYGYDILNISIDDIFNEAKLSNNIDDKKAIFTSRSDRNMNLLIDIWTNKIMSKNKSLKLFITPDSNFKNFNSKNILFRKMGDQSDLINDLITSRVMLVPGHKAELFCLAAEEARELCIPIVTLGIGSLKERVKHNLTGFIANNEEEFANYTLKLFENNDIWSKIRNNLIHQRGKKNWNSSSKDFLETLKK